ncbi:TonB-dependent receptor [Polymorphobacter sp.]|uniref:TonB-dependent receptor n=1 Tax=Polymorphobacter sp. TaxID=1909290 RepID=UPI003F729825
MNTTSVFLRTSALAALLVSSFAHAAEAEQAQTAAVDSAPAARDADEIIVTGLKRDQRLIEVPVAVSVFGAEQIQQAGIQRPSDFLQLTPNVSFNQSINRTDFFVNIRGQTSVRNAEPSVRIIVDGVPLSQPSEFVQELVDIEQIEVLRGPQGAFYGRNASAGVIVIKTKDLTDDWSGEVRGGYGNFNSMNGSVSFGGAIVPGVLKVRATLAANDTDGPFTNINTGEKPQRYREYIGRFRAIYTPTPELSVDFRVNLQNAKGGTYAYLPQIARHPLTPNGTVVGGVPITEVDTNNVDIPIVSDVVSSLRQNIFSTAVKIDYDFGGATLTSVTSWANVHQKSGGKNLPYGNAADASTNFGAWAGIFGDQTQNNDDEFWQFDQELRLSSNSDGAFKWQVGAEFLWTEWRRFRNVALNGRIPAGQTLLGYNGIVGGQRTLIGGGAVPLEPSQLYGVDSPYASRVYTINDKGGHNIAPFANIQYDVTDQLEIGLAGRYDIEQRYTTSQGTDAISPFSGQSFNQCVRILGLSLAECTDGRSRVFRQFSPKVNITYKIDNFGSVYASWGKGFKTGGYNDIGSREIIVRSKIPVFLAVPGTTPEQARAQAEASVFSQDSFDKEVATNYEIGMKGELFDRRLSFTIAGFITDLSNTQQYRFDPNASIASIDSVDASRIKGFEFDVQARLTDTFTLFGGYGYVDSKITRFLADPRLVGNRMPNTAKYNSVLGGQLAQPVTDTLTVNARAEWTRSGSMWFDIQNTPNTDRDAIDLVNVRLGVGTERFEVSAWARNLFNKKYATEAVVVFPHINVLTQAFTRQVGVEARYRF